MQASKMQALAEIRKQADVRRRVMTEVLQAEKAVGSKVMFEINSTKKIHKRRKEEALNALRQKREESVFERRKALAVLYNTELEAWREECMSNVETIEVRKERMLKKAKQLRDTREADRLQRAHDAIEQQWRDGCDDARDLDGKALTKFMSAERQKQIIEKEERDRLEADKENMFYQEWSKQLDAMAAKDDAKMNKAKEANIAQRQGLMEQLQYQEDMKQHHYETTMGEAAEEIQATQDGIQAEIEKEKQRKLDEHRRGREVLEFNAQYKDMAEAKRLKEETEDALLLEHALQQERAQIGKENAKKKAGADAAKQYRAFLEEMMIKEAEDNSFVDEINKRESEKIWNARDAALQARQDARDYLMKLVHEGRQEQIAYKQALQSKEKEEGKMFASKFMEDIKLGMEKDRADQMYRRNKNVANLNELKTQISEREHLKNLEQQEVFLEDKRMNHIEGKHRERLAAQGGQVKLHYPKRAVTR